MDGITNPVDVLLLLSHFSRVQLCATPQTAARQAPPSLGFSRQEHWSGFLQCRKAKSESEVAQSCPTLSNPMDCSLPGSPVHGIFQAAVLEWGAIAFSVFICISHFIYTQLTLGQHRFELYRFTYTHFFFFSKHILQNYTVCGWLNPLILVIVFGLQGDPTSPL